MKKVIPLIAVVFIVIVVLIIVLLMPTETKPIDIMNQTPLSEQTGLRNRLFNFTDESGQSLIIVVDNSLIGYIPNALLKNEDYFIVNGNKHKLFDKGLWISKIQLEQSEVDLSKFGSYDGITEDYINYPYFIGEQFIGYTQGLDSYGRIKVASVEGDVQKLMDKIVIDEQIDEYNKQVEKYNASLPQQGGE